MLLVERLQARLRPKPASMPSPPDPSIARARLGQRCRALAAQLSFQPAPCWLLPRPQPLSEVGGRPQRDGSLTLLAGPERIEKWLVGCRGSGGRRRCAARLLRRAFLHVMVALGLRCHEGLVPARAFSKNTSNFFCRSDNEIYIRDLPEAAFAQCWWKPQGTTDDRQTDGASRQQC